MYAEFTYRLALRTFRAGPVKKTPCRTHVEGLIGKGTASKQVLTETFLAPYFLFIWVPILNVWSIF